MATSTWCRPAAAGRAIRLAARSFDGKLYGRGACDMKAGIAAAVFAVEAIRRAGIAHAAPLEISGTVDEESGGFAGVGWLAENGLLSRARTRAVIIPEPFGVDRVCIGHRGVYWFEVIAEGRIAHGSMPYLGINAIEGMSHLLDLVRDELGPALFERVTAMPVVPDGSRHATININGIDGGQPIDGVPSPCVADRCRVVFDRRFLMEEGLERTRAEIAALVARAQSRMPDVQVFDRGSPDLRADPHAGRRAGDRRADRCDRAGDRPAGRARRQSRDLRSEACRADRGCAALRRLWAGRNWIWRISLMNTAVSRTSSPPPKSWRSRS